MWWTSAVWWTSAQITNHLPEELKDRLVIGAMNPPDNRIAGRTSEFLLLDSYAEGRSGPTAVPRTGGYARRRRRLTEVDRQGPVDRGP